MQYSLVSRERELRGDSLESSPATGTGSVAIAVTGATAAGPLISTPGIGAGAIAAAVTAAAAGASTSGSTASTVAAAQAAALSGSNTVTGNLCGGGGVVRGMRGHSPSNRRSREQIRRGHGSDQGGLLAHSGFVIGDLGAGMEGTTTLLGVGAAAGSLEDSRLSYNDDCHQSFISDEADGNPAAALTDSGKKSHHRSPRSSSAQAIDRLNTKIQCTKESIRKEQTARDDNVNEYLKLAASADKQQLQRIKAVFEKKNQKSAHSISQLQKKLESYSKRAKDIQNHQYHHKGQHRQPREMLRDVGQGLRNVGGNIRDGITGFSGSVMSKPREFAHLIKNKFGSADNINQLSEAELQGIGGVHAELGGSTTATTNNNNVNNTNSNQTSTANPNTGSGGIGSVTGKFNSDNGSECSSVTSESMPAGSGKSQSGASQYQALLKTLLNEIAERKEENDKLKERVERLEASQKEYNNLTATLETERYRAETLEEQINDLTELHQTEIENMKTSLADMEERVQYQSDDRMRDVNEVLENCQTRITKMEHLMQQQFVSVEGIEDSNARAVVVKLVNVVLTVLQLILLIVSTATRIVMPFVKTRVRVLTTVISVVIFVYVIRQWPEVQDIGTGLMQLLKRSLVTK